MTRFKRWITVRYVVPLCFVGILTFILARGLQQDPSELPSALINKPMPQLELLEIFSNQYQHLNLTLKNKVALINVCATWCQTCLNEHALLKKLANQNNVNLYAIIYKDQPKQVLSWLSQAGNPFKQVWLDQEGSAGIELGVYGTPELYIIDSHGFIQYRHAGILNEKLIHHEILPLVNRLTEEAIANV